MPGFDVKTAIVVLWGLTALLLAWTWVPALIAALGGTRYQCGGTNDTHGMETSTAQPDYAFWAEQLRWQVQPWSGEAQPLRRHLIKSKLEPRRTANPATQPAVPTSPELAQPGCVHLIPCRVKQERATSQPSR